LTLKNKYVALSVCYLIILSDSIATLNSLLNKSSWSRHCGCWVYLIA